MIDELPKTRLTGNLTYDPQVYSSKKSGEEYTILRIAINKDYIDKKTGEKIVAETDFYSVFCFGTLASRASHLKKGNLVQIKATINPGKIKKNEEETADTIFLTANNIFKLEILPKASMLSKVQDGVSV